MRRILIGQVFKGVITLMLWMLAATSWAQNSKVLPTEPTEFIEEFETRIAKLGDKGVQDFVKGFKERWIMGNFTDSEKENFINRVNVMLLKNYAIQTEVLTFTKACDLFKSDTAKVKLDYKEFEAVADSTIQDMDRVQANRVFLFIYQYMGTGTIVKTSSFNWSLSQANPSLRYKTMVNPETGKAVHFPYLIFDNTDAVFRSPKDSTKIYGTHGELNVMNRIFKAEGGKIDWSKMKLDPNDVYAELLKYTLNMNYTNVHIDTVVFHYNSLIPNALKGEYIDNNKGYTDINKANFPSFRSYDGGVVIENFIKNVRYEGGFSLRGIKKYGSYYYKWVEAPKEAPKPKKEKEEEEEVEDTYEQDFGYQYDENAYFFDDEDVLPDTYGEEEPEEGGEDEATEEEDLGPLAFMGLDPAHEGMEYKRFKAQLTIFRNSEPAMKLKANEFVLDLEKLFSKRTEVSVYLSKTDSLTHPSVDVIYDVDSATVTLVKDVKDKMARQAFLSPYHNFFFYFDAIKWNTKTDIIQFTSIIDKENRVSAIESKDFFNYYRWSHAKGLLAFHPVGAIYRYISLYPDNAVTPEAICDENGKPGEVEKFIMEMENIEGSGYVTYDKVTHIITPLPKLFDWAKAARARKDYDAIQIISQVKAGNNAELNLQDLEIDMKGVAFFPLSDSQFVRVQPNLQRVTVKKNRDLQFDGIVAAGKLNFYGRLSQDTGQVELPPGKFTFQYDNYKVLVDSLDSLRFVLDRSPDAERRFSPLQKALRATTIEGVTGAIYINKPTNKSGVEPHPEYPVFDSYTKSYVYWAKANVRGGIYTKDKLNFSIDPFVLDSLEDFNERALSFEGEFYSSEIFPKIRQKLSVMEDQTLGMKDVTPADTGYAAYDGKGRFTGEIVLDGDGLSSKGKMNFMHTVANSDSFKMFFDSVKAVTNSFNMPGGEYEGAVYPEIDAKTVNYTWLTKKDEIELETMEKGEAIVMFGGEGTFEGKLRITKEGLRGSGKVTMGNVTVESDDIVFGEKDFKTENGTFTVVDPNNPGKKIFMARDSKIDYDVAKHNSSFVSNTVGVPNAAFPDQKYRTSLGQGQYSRKNNDIKLQSLSPKAKDNYFMSYDPKQDSLVYNATSAYYNLDARKIEIDGVPYIYVADAKITPDSSKVSVKPDGYLQKLDNARIEANQVTSYHQMYDGKIDIMSSKNYLGSSRYDYIEYNNKKQYINLVEMGVQGDTMTVAKGFIPEDQNFYLTDRIFFKGSTYLEGNKKFLHFTGEVKIDSENEFFADKWFKFDDDVNPDSVFIEITKEQLGALVVGMHYIKRNRIYYSTFLGTKKNADDLDVSLVEGGLTYDTGADEFKIGPRKKLTGVEYRGATSSLDDKNNIITTVGRLNFPYNFGKNTIEVEMAGRWRDDAGKREISSMIMANLNFSCVPKEAWAKLAEKAGTVLAINNDVNFADPIFRQSIAEFLDPKYTQEDKNMQEFLGQVEKMQVASEVKPAKWIPGSLLISDIAFKFDPDYKSMYYAGEIGLLGVNGTSVNKMTTSNSKMEYAKGKYTPAGAMLPDTLRLLLEFDEYNWVFYEYYNEVLYTTSSDLDGYNAVLRAEIDKRKKNEGYRFELCDEARKTLFQTSFANKYIWRTNRPKSQPEENTNGGNDNNGGGNGNGGNNGGSNNGGNDNGGGDNNGGGNREGGTLNDGMDDDGGGR